MTLRRRNFAADIFLHEKYYILIQIQSKESNQWRASIGSYNGLTPNGRQTIIKTNDGL